MNQPEPHPARFDAMPPDLHRELSSRGGKASGAARQEKAALQKALLERMENYALVEGFIDDLRDYRRWKKRRDKARANRGRTTRSKCT